MKKLIVLIIAATLLNGCVYYNVFFNAKKYFNEAQEMELHDTGKPKSSAIQNYNKTIKKCGIVLTEYKDTKWADDALFLLAQCLFYKGTSYIQSIEKFEDLILFYPESEYVPEAKIYIARAHYGFNKKAEALDLLREFINDETFVDDHPLALMTLANFQMDEEDLLEAEFYYNQIIDKYPKSDQYEEAYFLLGKTHFKGEDYLKSINVFTSLLKSRLPKKIKLNSRYYIALDYLLLSDYKKSYKISKKLVTDEYRESEISKIQMIVARSQIGLGRYEKATLLLENIMEDNKKSALSAEAAFYIGEMYLNDLHDYELAIEYYNKVKNEYSRSEFVPNALSKSAVASQILQYNDPNTEIEANQLVNEQLKLAEYYIEVLSLPDSALIVYNKIISSEDILTVKLDSLNLKIIELEKLIPAVDTLTITDTISLADNISLQDSVSLKNNVSVKDSLYLDASIAVYDTLAIDTLDFAYLDSSAVDSLAVDSLAIDSLAIDSLAPGIEIADSSFSIVAVDVAGAGDVVLDSLQTNFLNADSLQISENLNSKLSNETDKLELPVKEELIKDTIIDSLSTITNMVKTDSVETKSVIDTTQIKLDRYIFERDKTATDIGLYQEEIIPFVNFIKLWVYKNIYQDSIKVDSTFAYMQSKYNGHKYTLAAAQYINGEEVDFSSPELIAETEEYKMAILDFETDADTTSIRLQPIAERTSHAFNLQANYALGYLNYFELADSTNAKTYLNYVLDQDSDEIYTSNINIFYDGEHFISYDRLPYLDVLDQKAEEKKQLEEEEATRLAEEELALETNVDSLLVNADSLKVSLEIPKKKILETKDAAITKRSGVQVPPQFQDMPQVIIAEIEIFASGTPGKIKFIKPKLHEKDKYAKFLTSLLRSWEYSPAMKKGVQIGSKSKFEIDLNNE